MSDRTNIRYPGDSPLGIVARRFADAGAEILYVKVLAPNDNSKNQVYLAGSLSLLNMLPISGITTSDQNSNGEIRYKAALELSWLLENGHEEQARSSQLILYPQYPEVRLSGFLKGCKSAPNAVMTVRDPGRLLFLGVTRDRRILASAFGAESEESIQVRDLGLGSDSGVLVELPVVRPVDSEVEVRRALAGVHKRDWIDSKRLNSNGRVLECNAPQCVGYTLEAELGVQPNSLAEPDYLGWELKAYTVPDYSAPGVKVVTLMTPEPDSGLYSEQGPEQFVRAYGYADAKGRVGRANFSSTHRHGAFNAKTGLTLLLEGYDGKAHRMVDPDGGIILLDQDKIVAAKWSFRKLLEHWNKKHSKAVFVPAEKHREPPLRYRYGALVGLGTGADFNRVLSAIADGQLYYDPGLKLTGIGSSSPRVKRRNQFRMKSTALSRLYETFRQVLLREC